MYMKCLIVIFVCFFCFVYFSAVVMCVCVFVCESVWSRSVNRDLKLLIFMSPWCLKRHPLVKRWRFTECVCVFDAVSFSSFMISVFGLPGNSLCPEFRDCDNRAANKIISSVGKRHRVIAGVLLTCLQFHVCVLSARFLSQLALLLCVILCAFVFKLVWSVLELTYFSFVTSLGNVEVFPCVFEGRFVCLSNCVLSF